MSILSLYRGNLGALEENHPRTRVAEELVSVGRHNIAVLEWNRMLRSGDRTRNVHNVCHQQRADLISDRAELREVDHPGGRRGTTQDHCWSEGQCLLPKLIDETSLVVDLVRQGCGAEPVGTRSPR